MDCQYLTGTVAHSAPGTHVAALHRLAAALLEHEVVERDEIAAIISATAPSQAPETEQPAPVAGSA